jgi:hypothetical protein
MKATITFGGSSNEFSSAWDCHNVAHLVLVCAYLSDMYDGGCSRAEGEGERGLLQGVRVIGVEGSIQQKS